ncbi:hypothetical protein OPV22_018951 [Ensete ventricosum]|uniref:Uncharacterized protein n=1 Tax=Ensete ventricosum TaxID=4639 RepID=A0AAV8QWR6_ENSVE|nr:hypothetical protein OPV22_018951 [Ensete ventricosum]
MCWRQKANALLNLFQSSRLGFWEPLGGAPLYLPQNAGLPQLQEIVNKLLKNMVRNDTYCTIGRSIFIYDLLESHIQNIPLGHKKWITGISWEPMHLQAPCRCFWGGDGMIYTRSCIGNKEFNIDN